MILAANVLVNDVPAVEVDKNVFAFGDGSVASIVSLMARGCVIEGVAEPTILNITEQQFDESARIAQGLESFNALAKGEWNEDDHPRDESGRFTSGGSFSDSIPTVGTNYSANSRPGNGDLPINDNAVSSFKGGSAAAHLVKDANGGVHFTAERQALHDSIIESIVARSAEEDGQPTMYVTGGGAASGKSALTGDLADLTGMPTSDEIAIVDPDAIKAEIPEYAQMVRDDDPSAAGFAHEESSYLAKRATAALIENNRSFVLDGVNNTSVEKVVEKIENAREQGYRVVGAYVTADIETALSRAEARAEATGRDVPLTAFYAGHAGVSKIFTDIAGKFDKITLVDNNGSTPIVIGSGEGGQFNVVNDDLFQRFLNKADYTPPQR